MTVNTMDDTHESSNFDTNGGVKTNQQEMKTQLENDWSSHQDQGHQPASPTNKKKKNRPGYWKDKKASRKQAQAAGDGDMNDNGGVSTSVPTEKDETNVNKENESPRAGETVDTTQPNVETQAPLATEQKVKSKNGKKSKVASHPPLIQDRWPSSASLDDDFIAGGWDESVTQNIWRIENNRITPAEDTKAKKTRTKKKAAKPKVTAELDSEYLEGDPLNLKSGNVGTPMGANGAKIGEDGTPTKETVAPQPKGPKKNAKKKAKADKPNAQVNSGTISAPNFMEDDGVTGMDTQHKTSVGGINGPSPSEPSGTHHQSLNDETNDVDSERHTVNAANSNTEIPMSESSNSKEQKPKQMKIQVDLDLELAAVLKAKVKGEMMITFIN
ncbi:hypothetical protein MauCBS54593_006704 [Microsporum audouinii]